MPLCYKHIFYSCRPAGPSYDTMNLRGGIEGLNMKLNWKADLAEVT